VVLEVVLASIQLSNVTGRLWLTTKLEFLAATDVDSVTLVTATGIDGLKR